MTMLDRMRRHKAWLKWSLAVVCATFVLLYVPQFLDPTGTGGAPAPGATNSWRSAPNWAATCRSAWSAGPPSASAGASG